MKKIALTTLAVVILIQFAIPLSMIYKRECVLRKGTVYAFKTRPIDPADPFQGRYVNLGIREDYLKVDQTNSASLKYKGQLYAMLETDEEGFAHFSDWSLKTPVTDNYLKTRYRGIKRRWISDEKRHEYQGLRIDIPFTRFYMDEAKAPRAERLTREASRATNCWVNVRIYKGASVIEDVFAEGQSLSELAAE